MDAAAKADLLRSCEERARAAGDEVAQVTIELRPGPPRWWRSTTPTGSSPADDRTRVRLSAQVVARRDGRVETGTDTRGGHAGWELVSEDPEEVADSAARKALTLLDAVDAPTGRLPVVVGNGFGGVLLHEAVGHGLESDAVQKRASIYAGRLGEQAGRVVRHRLRRRPAPERVGQRRDRRRGHAHPPHDGDRGRRADLLPLRHPARAQGRRRVHRQRPARVVPPPADPAHDEHLLRAR